MRNLPCQSSHDVSMIPFRNLYDTVYVGTSIKVLGTRDEAMEDVCEDTTDEV